MPYFIKDIYSNIYVIFPKCGSTDLRLYIVWDNMDWDTLDWDIL